MGILRKSRTAPVLSHLLVFVCSVHTQKHCFSCPTGLISTSSCSMSFQDIESEKKCFFEVLHVFVVRRFADRIMSGPLRALREGEADAASETQVGCVPPACASGPHLKNLH